MASTKEIQTRMHSIQDTMKITNAMYMISSAKLKKAKKTLDAADDHFFAIQESIDRILKDIPDVNTRYFGTDTPEEKKKGGLSGSYGG